MEDSAQLLPLPGPPDPISRPSSTSTQGSLAQLAGISVLAAEGSNTNSPQPRVSNLPTLPAPPAQPVAMLAGASPAATVAGPTGNLPVCQNCSTSTTPLWRRDEMGAVLCNACGLFLKLHGRPRPISLKTDVIKSRNRVKTSMRPDMAMKKKPSLPATVDANSTDLQNHANAAAAVLNARRAPRKSANGHADGDSPISRTTTPNMYNPHGLPAYPAMEDGQYQPHTLSSFTVSGTSPGRAPSPMNGDRLDAPQTQDQLLAANSSLKTRVSELEVINDFMQRRLAVVDYPGQEGQDTSNEVLRAQLEETKRNLEDSHRQLEESHRRENMLKRRLDEMEAELQAKNPSHDPDLERLGAKRPRLAGDAKPDAEEVAPIPDS